MDLGTGDVRSTLARWICHLAGVLPCILLFMWPGQPVAASEFDLSPAERQAVARHPVIMLAYSPGMPPFFTYDDEVSGPQGHAVEMATLAAERAGLRLEFKRYADLVQAREATRRGEADVLGFASVDSSPTRVTAGELLPIRPMLSVDMVLAVRRDIPDISPAGNFGGYRVAVESGSGADALLRERFPAVRLHGFPTPEAALRAVGTGDADIFVGHRPVVVHYLERLLMANVQVRGAMGPGLSPLGMAVSPARPWLQAVLDKSLGSVTQRERQALAERWLPPSTLLAGPPRAVALNAAEREWVDRHGRIRIGYDASFSPITQQNELKLMGGLGADFMRLAAGKAGLTIEREEGGPFAQIYARSVVGEIDVIVGAARTSVRRQHHDFVGPFLRVPTGIVTAVTGGLPITRIEELGRGRLALLDEHFLLPQLRTRHPALQLLTFPSQAAVLDAVADGRADAGIGNLKVVNQLVDARYTGRVRVTGTVDDADSELYFAVRRDVPELSLLLRRGLDAIAPSEALAIEQRWLAPVVSPASGVELRQVLRIAAVGLALVLWLGIWAYLLRRGNRRLRSARCIEQEARELAQASLASRGRFLGYLSHELRGSLGAIGAGAAMAREDPSAPRRDRVLEAIQASAEGLQVLLEATLQYEQQLDRPMVLDPQPFDLGREWSGMLAPFELTARAKGLLFSSRLEGSQRSADGFRFDGVRLRQVVNNLVGNAVKFTREGEVAVRAGVTGEGIFELSVEDSGPGLSDDDLTTLFQPYAQGEHGRRLRQGAGLGLAIARQIVDAMGGRIEVGRSAMGGARFLVSLPLSGQADAAPAADLSSAG